MARRLRLSHLWVILAVAVFFVVPSAATLNIVDIGWTIRGGEWMVQNGRLLVEDPFTSAPLAEGQVNQQWLAQLLYYGLYRLGGVELVVLGTALAGATAYALLLATVRHISGSSRLACLLAVAAFALGYSNLGARPQTLAYPLFGAFLLALAVGGRWRWALPPLMVVWANVHGTFVLGLLLVGAELLRSAEAGWRQGGWGAVWDRCRDHAVLLSACVIAACVTPYGPGSLLYVGKIGANPVIRDFLTEWAPSSVTTSEGALFYASVILVAGWLLFRRARGDRGLAIADLFMLAAFAWLAASTVRSVIWWGLIAAVVVARAIPASQASTDETPRRATVDIPALNWAIAVLVALVVGLSLPWLKPYNSFLPKEYRSVLSPDLPTGVAAHLQSHPYPGTMLNSVNWGGYFDFLLWPHHRPFLDTRAEVHPPEVWHDYIGLVYPSAQWQTLARKYDVGYWVLSVETNKDAITALSMNPGWRRDYADERAVVFVRVDSPEASRPSN